MNWRHAVVFTFLLALRTVHTGHATEPATAQPCASTVYHEFNFFVGYWDTYDVDAPGKVVARNNVNLILNGCVVHEDYLQKDGLHGQSYSIYDAARKAWHQSWVTNRGELLLLDGGMESGRMILTGKQIAKDGKPSFLRVVWYQQGDGVRETATRSIDSGKTWKPMFDILFKPHK